MIDNSEPCTSCPALDRARVVAKAANKYYADGHGNEINTAVLDVLNDLLAAIPDQKEQK